MSRSLAGFELKLNLPRCLLRREMVFLGTITGDSTCWWGGSTNSVDLDQVGRMVQIPASQGGRVEVFLGTLGFRFGVGIC